MAHPPPYKARHPVKRTKTYTGCWTCRARGTKCDEQRPGCQKCLNAKIRCEGYHLKLVWEDEQNNGNRVQRRTLIPEQQPERLSLTSNQINYALGEIESAASELDIISPASFGPFSVFTASLSRLSNLPEQICQDSNPKEGGSAVASPAEVGQRNHGSESAASVECVSEGTNTTPDQSAGDNVEAWWMDDANDVDCDESEAALTMISIKQRIQPQVTTYVSSASPEERSLLHYWITELSGMLIPTPRYDNPFRTIFIPLALAASDLTRKSSGNVALLHAIYAISAFNRARIPSSPDYLEDLGTEHHEISLHHLRKALSQVDAEADSQHQEAVLATIITMSSIEVMIGSSKIWRTHLIGGKSWLRSTIASNATQSVNFWMLSQIFFCIDTLGNPDPSLQNPENLLEELQTGHCPLMTAILDKQYCLERLFGITKPTLEAIAMVKILSGPTRHATEEEIDGLDVHIRNNDPDTIVSDLDGSEDCLIRHHTCAFFCATLIYFERRLRHTPARKLQRLVRRSLDHFDAIRALEVERGDKVCGLFWPEFVTACEAEDMAGSRARSLQMFEKGRSKGIGNVVSAEKVVLDVWQRRDCSTSDDDVTWESSMANLGLDIILT